MSSREKRLRDTYYKLSFGLKAIEGFSPSERPRIWFNATIDIFYTADSLFAMPHEDLRMLGKVSHSVFVLYVLLERLEDLGKVPWVNIQGPLSPSKFWTKSGRYKTKVKRCITLS